MASLGPFERSDQKDDQLFLVSFPRTRHLDTGKKINVALKSAGYRLAFAAIANRRRCSLPNADELLMRSRLITHAGLSGYNGSILAERFIVQIRNAVGRARDMMLKTTDSKHAPWHVVHSDDKKRARLNCISHILSLIPYKKIQHKKIKLPKRSNKGKYDDRASLKKTYLVPEKY